MENLEIRLIVSGLGLKYRDIARELGITPSWLSRLMKKPLTKENRDRIMEAIESLGREKS